MSINNYEPITRDRLQKMKNLVDQKVIDNQVTKTVQNIRQFVIQQASRGETHFVYSSNQVSHLVPCDPNIILERAMASLTALFPDCSITYSEFKHPSATVSEGIIRIDWS